jgi:5-formyltetrahydrofolate cyclo-ligase
MITGIGISEVIAILLLVLLFFGSKELPRIIREVSSFIAKARSYSDKMRRELSEITADITTVPTTPAPLAKSVEQKKELREHFRNARKALTAQQRCEKSAQIHHHLLSLPRLESAKTVLIYLHSGSEVLTDELLERLQALNKRILVPYCRVGSRDLGIAEITDWRTQIHSGEHGLREPIHELRDNFLKSDIHAVICPAVAFDSSGGRLGQGLGYYDRTLRELQGRAYLVGIGFDCQIHPHPLPFDHHDVAMDQVVTESGPLIPTTPVAPPVPPNATITPGSISS